MKIQLPTFMCIILLIVACGNDSKKTETTPENQATTEVSKPTSVADQIVMIKENFSKIENQQESFVKKETMTDAVGVTIELLGFYKENTPAKIVKLEAGEHGSTKTSYYFKDNTLFFVFQQEFSEVSMNGPFTGIEHRFYIADGKLIRVLKKGKTFESVDIDLTKVENEDVTATWKNESTAVAEFTKSARKASALLLETSIGLDDGRWISNDDPNAGIELKDGKLIMFHESATATSNDVYDYQLTEHEGVEYLTLIDKKGDKLEYSILEYTDEIFIISYLVRGNKLTYSKEK
ncbi:hypothetical protein [Kordia sp.]|uniref:hypothetical protein n=1 Tax=Kordia sp. TaxID=1965332 RepID=UPI003D2B7601